MSRTDLNQVGALGWPNNTFFDVKDINAPHAFHNTEVHPLIENAFQALALDEHRAAFPPTLWSLPKPKTVEEKQLDRANGIPDLKTTNLIQCWFPGYHINIGGGNDDMLKERKGDFESMANITFAWMVDRVQQYTSLGFSDEAISDVIERYATNITSVIEEGNPVDGKNHNQVYKGWGIGPNLDSMDVVQSIAGSVTRTPAQYIEGGRITNEFIHPVVAFALDKSTTSTWKPKSLEGFQRIPNTLSGKGYVWQKTFIAPPPKKEEGVVQKAKSTLTSGLSGLSSYVRGKSTPVLVGQKLTLTLPEFVIPPDTEVEGKHSTAWQGHSVERHLISADTSRYVFDDKVGAKERKEVIKVTVDFIKKMDRENGFEESELKLCNLNIAEGGPEDEGAQESQRKKMKFAQPGFEKTLDDVKKLTRKVVA